MNSPRPLLTDALLRDALIRRAAGPPVTAVLLDDVLTAVAGTLQRRAWGLLLPMARPIAILVALALLLAAIVAGALAAGGALRGDPQLRGDPATVVAQYAEIHVGWVYLYADGRAVYHPDGPTHERRLTQTGVDLVRSGAVPVSAVLKDPGQLPTRAWADAEARLYEPAKYAICYGILAAAGWSGDPNANEPSFGEPSPADGSFDLVIDPELVLPHGVIQGWGG